MHEKRQPAKQFDSEVGEALRFGVNELYLQTSRAGEKIEKFKGRLEPLVARTLSFGAVGHTVI